MFASIKLYAAAAVAALVAGLVIMAKVLRSQRDRARKTAKTLKATVVAQRKTKKAVKVAETELFSRVAEIKKELKQSEDEFEGVGDLANLSDRSRKRRVRK